MNSQRRDPFAPAVAERFARSSISHDSANTRAWLGPQIMASAGTVVALLAAPIGHLPLFIAPSPPTPPYSLDRHKTMPALHPRLAGSLVAMVIAITPACRSSDSEAHPASRTAGGSASTARNVPAANDSLSQLADRGRIQGSASAPVWVVEVSDFQCPYCRMWHDSTYSALVRDYVSTGKVRLAYLNFPLQMHVNALPAAEAAMCASAQSKFWPMHDALFNSQDKWERLADPTAFFDSLARSVGVDRTQWAACATKHLARPLIEADKSRSEERGVQSTPSFFIGDETIAGAQPYTDFRAAIERQLAKAAKSPAR
jgi:protein-disulfide isomerase